MSEPTDTHARAEPTADVGTDERRAWVRHACQLEAQCQPLSARQGEARWEATVRDVSAGGIGLVLGRSFQPGAVLTVEVPGAGGEPRQLFARVRHARRQADGRWLVGCEFPTKLGEAEVRELL